ncbi:MAG: sigma-70 family RNA polymerase sigma factor [Candidatus Kapaibacterium sp.]|nr:sigma-70 family RNA polymerase sigma factor [Ignavibacteriota bacterium]MCB9220717.1 sigma-70 family RNA polymerase sigma factor [Ignavibacteria bacterium]
MKNKKNKSESKQEDFDAIKRVLEGDNSAYEFLQKKYKNLIYSLVKKMIKNDSDVEDLVQETFIKAYKALDKFKFNYSFSAWIYRIASNNTIDFLRKRRFDTFSIDKPIGNAEDENYFEIEDNSYSPDSELINQQKSDIISAAIDTLPENYREIILLRHEEELDYKTIAEQLDLPLGTVKAHLFRARKLLYEELKDKYNLLNNIK